MRILGTCANEAGHGSTVVCSTGKLMYEGLFEHGKPHGQGKNEIKANYKLGENACGYRAYMHRKSTVNEHNRWSHVPMQRKHIC